MKHPIVCVSVCAVLLSAAAFAIGMARAPSDVSLVVAQRLCPRGC